MGDVYNVFVYVCCSNEVVVGEFFEFFLFLLVEDFFGYFGVVEGVVEVGVDDFFVVFDVVFGYVVEYGVVFLGDVWVGDEDVEVGVEFGEDVVVDGWGDGGEGGDVYLVGFVCLGGLCVRFLWWWR